MALAPTPHKKRRADLLGEVCKCCKGYAFYPKSCGLEGCDHLIHVGDDKWVSLNIMHHDRVGIGPIPLCSPEHALAWLAQQLERREDGTQVSELRLPGCTLAGHLPELQAIYSALSRAAQVVEDGHKYEIDRAQIDAGKLLVDYQQRSAFERARTAHRETVNASYWSGVDRGLLDMLRAIEGSLIGLHALAEEALKHIDWNADPPYYDPPGNEPHVIDLELAQVEVNGSAETQADR